MPHTSVPLTENSACLLWPLTSMTKRICPRPKSGAAAERTYPKSKVGVVVEKSYPMSKVRGGG